MGDYATVDDGGAFLCFEGVEKMLHMLEARKHKRRGIPRRVSSSVWRSWRRRIR
ncbi:hypothetical protein ACNKHL_11870 [Shigella flexneri]